MKKNLFRKSIFLILLLIVLAFTGCSRETGVVFDPDIVYVPEFTEKIVLTLASFAPHHFDPAVAEFNRTNTSYKIELVDIQRDYGAWPDGIDKMILEIIAGSGPDMVHPYQLHQFPQWVKQGLFEDLYDFIDTDHVLDRSDFLDSILRGFETDGKLYQMAPGVSIRTIIGHPDIVGSDSGWDINEFITVIESNPQAILPLGSSVGGIGTISLLLNNNIKSFIDWETGTVSFDNDHFIKLLEFSYSVESGFKQSNVGVSENAPLRRITAGEQIMERVHYSRLEEYSAFQVLFGGDFIFKGFPTDTGSGNTIETIYGLAMTTVSEHKDGAWEFFRMYLSEDWQRQTLSNRNYLVQYLPTNRIIFEEKLAGAMVEFVNPYVYWGDLTTTAKPLTYEDIKIIRNLVNSVSYTPAQLDDPLNYLIMEVMLDFLADRITAQDAARIIQNRASTYVSEQN